MLLAWSELLSLYFYRDRIAQLVHSRRKAEGEIVPLNAFARIGREQAVACVQEYFSTDEHGNAVFTGSKFESYGDISAETDNITAEDLLAVSMLSINIPASAALGITGPLRSRITALLGALPVQARFEELNDKQFESLLGPDSPAQHLWDLLRQTHGERWGVGQTTASKLMARKRPHLIPIFDSVIAEVTGMKGSLDQWSRWRSALAPDGGALSSMAIELDQVRKDAGQEELSILRTLDIVLWMSGRSRTEKDNSLS